MGVRGSTPAPGIEFVRYGGHTSSVAIARDGDAAPTLILDAGTGIRRATELCRGEAFRGTILLSHLHWDHLHGLPFFSAADREDSRVALYLPEQPDGASAVETIARGMSPPHFPVRPDELRGSWAFRDVEPGERQFDGFRVSIDEIPHKGGRTFGYRVSDGHAVLAYMSDHCPTLLGPGPDGLGEYHPAAVALARHADVLVHDAQLVEEELEREAWLGHAAAEYAVKLGRRCGVKTVVLFHHRPDRVDDALDSIGQRFTSPPPQVTVAAQSLVLDL